MTGDPDAGRDALAEAARRESARVYGQLCRETRRPHGDLSGNDADRLTEDTLDEIVRRRRVLLSMPNNGSLGDVPMHGHEASA